VAPLVVLLCALGGTAPAQEPALSTVKDEIFARKILMDTIDSQLDAIDWMLVSDKPLDLEKASERADNISVMLMTFPHLFRPATNQWHPKAKRDPARDTFASPEVWTQFAEFYRQAAAASRIAFDASRAKLDADFRAHIESLRDACAACHARYLKVDE
jgi:cytochrome c556